MHHPCLRRLLGAALLLLSPVAGAQTAPLSSSDVAWVHDTGAVSNDGARGPAVVASFTVRVADASWLRLRFSRVLLAGDPERDGTILRITSHLDGGVQELNKIHVRQWRNHTAYFNGDAVQVDVVAWPGTGPSRVELEAVVAGDPPVAEVSQCGATDDRVPSTDPRVGRLVPLGCTAWIIDDCAHCMLTAGHCSPPTTLQFNVPQSGPSGGLNNPHPDHQYSLDPSSLQAMQGLVGNDWGYFGVFPNSNTGLLPHEAQGAYFTLELPPPVDLSENIRITGFGADSGPANQTNQTHVGPWRGLSGTTLRYHTDTEGGNSGSPVIHEETGVGIGIHTHGGCSNSSSSSNAGTASSNTGLQLALSAPLGQCNPVIAGCDDPPVGTPYCDCGSSAPCGNESTGGGCLHSGGIGASATVSGSASVAADDLVVAIEGMPTDKFGLIYMGSSQIQVPFGDGQRCVGGGQTGTFRWGVTNSGAAGRIEIGPGLAAASAMRFPPAGQITSGDTWNFQGWFRDPMGPCASGFNTSNAISVTFQP